VRPSIGLHHIIARQDIAARIAGDLCRQPPCCGIGADKDEESAAVMAARGARGAFMNVDRCQMSITVGRAPSDRSGRYVDLPRCSSSSRTCSCPGSPGRHRHPARVVGELQRRLTGRVAGSTRWISSPWVMPPRSLDARSGPPCPQGAFEAFDFELAPGDAGRDDDRSGAGRLTIRKASWLAGSMRALNV
jgi:hypothetical protein